MKTIQPPLTGLDTRVRFLLWLSRLMGKSFKPGVSVAALRAAYAELNRRFGFPDRGGVTTKDLTIPTPDGASIAARLYRPVDAPHELPGLVYFHGGGWVIGDIDVYDHLTRYFAREGNIAVIAVDYRLGPEHRFPVAFDDAFTAFAWLRRHALEYQLDAGRLAVGGDSAGGGLAASLSAFAAERGLARPAFQLLIYPSVDGSARFASRTAFTDGLPLTSQTTAWFARHFLRSADDAVAPFLTTLDAPHPEALPPTYLLAARFDPLVDEGYAYAERLRKAGVDVTYDLRETLPHAFVNMAGAVPEARRALRDAIHATAAALRAVQHA